jgi:hypothetical protein
MSKLNTGNTTAYHVKICRQIAEEAELEIRLKNKGINMITGVDALKLAVEYWHKRYLVSSKSDIPPYVNKLCHIIYKLKKEVFNFESGTWEYEGF